MARNRRKRLRMTRPRIDWRAPLLAGSLLATLVTAAWPLFLLLDRPIRAIEIEAPFRRVLADRIEAAVASGLPGGFLSADLVAMQGEVARIPWVDRVQIERRWPDVLRITLTEQVAAARWGESGLLNMRGELFTADERHVPVELPKLAGPDGMEAEVAHRYRDLHRRLLRAGMGVTALSVDERGAWRLELSNGVGVQLGRHDIDARIDRLVAVVTVLIASRPSEIAYIDLRYSNGFAVGWSRSMNAERSVSGKAVPNA
ncbi:MAG TPA: cell division protein FtsQ/DivIB [Gammaproteobacteria bacterium]|nr:cell division protein FtsQ/DivIB [Gammaproteobacteria bacterium]